MNKLVKLRRGSRNEVITSIRKIKGRTLPLPEMRITAGASQQRGKVQHGAIDIGIPVGTPVYAIADGYILTAKQLPESKSGIYEKHGGTSSARCGSLVNMKIPHPQTKSGFTYVGYCHLRSVNPTLKKGMFVKGGTLLGYSGGKPGDPGAGNTTGPHLHITIRPGDTYFKSNSLAAKDEVYSTWFDDAKEPGKSNVGKIALVLGGIGLAGFLL